MNSPLNPVCVAVLVALTPVTRAGENPSAASDDVPAVPTFHAPVAMKAAGQPVRVEEPGYAAPAWHDVDGDGRADLVVGQFAKGKMAVYRGIEGGQLAERTWLQADGKVAEIPGVW